MVSIFGGEVPTRIVLGSLDKKPRAIQRENTGADKLWKAARILRRFTRTDLLITTADDTGQPTVSFYNVWNFIRRYRDAGYILMTAKGSRRAGQEATWALVKDPGPRRPPYKTPSPEGERKQSVR